MADSDATFVVDADVPAFLKDVDKMASGAQSRFQKLGSALKGIFSSGQPVSGGMWQQTPVARTTKELEAQHKTAKEMLKIESQRRDIARAERFERNRARYGEGAFLTEEGELRRQRRDMQRARLIGNVATGIHAAGNIINSGGSNASIAQGVGAAAGMVLPELKPIIDAATALFTTAFEKQALFREQGLRRFQAGGLAGVNIDEGTFGRSERKFYDMAKGLGFDITAFSSLYTRAAHSGAFDKEKNPQMSLLDLMSGESGFGIGSNMTGLFGAAQRTGSSQDNQKTLGAAFGLALQEGLSRGRLGEVFDQLAAAIESNTEATTDIKDTADRFLFISQLGPQFKGNTPAARAMEESIKGLAQGNTGYTLLTSLAAAGFGSGKSFSEALLATQKGVGTVGGLSEGALIGENFSRFVPAYARASAKGKADIVFMVSRLSGMSGPKVEAILNRLSAGPLGQVDVEKGGLAFSATAGVPDTLLIPRSERAGGENKLRFGIGEVKMPGGADSFRADALPIVGGSGGGATSQQFMDQYVPRGGGSFGAPRATGPHPGLDLQFPPGTTVYSPCDGLIIAARVGSGNEVGFGLLIKDDATGEIWRIFHLDPKTVSKSLRTGARITKGQFLGRTFKTDFTGGSPSHLHAGMSHDVAGKQLVDPSTVADLDSLIHPVVGQSSSSSAVPPVLPSATAVSSGGAAGGNYPSSQAATSVSITIIDKTRGGVDVQKEVQRHAVAARVPAPGDVTQVRK